MSDLLLLTENQILDNIENTCKLINDVNHRRQHQQLDINTEHHYLNLKSTEQQLANELGRRRQMITPPQFKILEIFRYYGTWVRLETLEETLFNRRDRLITQNNAIYNIEELKYHFEDDNYPTMLFKKGSIFKIHIRDYVNCQNRIKEGDTMTRIVNPSANNITPEVVDWQYTD